MTKCNRDTAMSSVSQWGKILHLSSSQNYRRCQAEFPREWFIKAKLSPQHPDHKQNCFKLKSRLSLQEWQRRGWIIGPDPRGWFQWYCRYYMGRRIPEIDRKQIQRWRAFNRHRAQVEYNCMYGDLDCRPRQRQALLQWAYNPFI